MIPGEPVDVNQLSLEPALSAGLSLPKSCLTQAEAEIEACAICLETIVDRATALPCNHDQFDFPCLGTWMHQQRVCPLCKAEIRSIKYISSNSPLTPHFFHLPVPQQRRAPPGDDSRQRRARLEYHRSRRNNQPSRAAPTTDRDTTKDTALEFRRSVYRNKSYSSHVGTNRISRYRNISPASFQNNTHLITRAKMFIRRELSVFRFLDPSASATASSSLSINDAIQDSTRDRRASNAEFLLEYIISILKSIDLKGSSGQAEELLGDFLGRANARLFCHELEAWLRSPYERLEHWDSHVQYADLPSRD